MSARPLLLVALAAGALGFLLGTLAGRGGAGGEDASLLPPGGDSSAPAPDALIAENRILEQRLREVTVRAREAEAALTGGLPLSGGAVAGAAPGGDPAGDSTAALKAGPRFFPDEYQGALGTVDWRLVGGNLHEMVGLLARGMPAVLRRQPIPKEIATRIQHLNSPVLAAAIQVRDHLPGNGVLGKFTSSPFVVNAIAAALELAGLPLDPDQEGRILAIAVDSLARDRRRLAGYGDAPWAIQQLLDEVALKDSLYADVFAVLTPAQTAALRTESTRDRVRLDLFSAALLFAGRLEVFAFKDEEQLAALLEARVARSMGFTPVQRTALAGEYRRWAAGIPRSDLDADVDLFDVKGMVAGTRATAWAGHFLTLFQTLAAEPTLVQKQRDALRGVSNVLVPLAADRIAAAK